MNLRHIFLTLLVVAGLGAAPAAALDLEAALADRVLGDPDAPVTVLEYASYTCPHCAALHNEAMPEIKKRFIDTGKAKLIFRDFPLDGVAARAGMIARCLPASRFYPFVDVLFANQDQWSRASDPVVALKRLGRLAGLGESEMEACLTNEPLLDGIIEMRMEGHQKYGVEATPTLVINGKTYRGATSVDAVASAIESAAKGS